MMITVSRKNFSAESSSFDEMTLLYRRFLRLIVILPFDGRDFTCLASRLLLVCSLVTSILHSSMFALYTINMKGVPSIDSICESVLVVGVYVRYYLLLPRRLELAELLEECRRIWDECDEDERCAVREFERKVRVLFRCLLASCVLTNVMYSLSAVAITFDAMARASRDNLTQAKHFLPYKWFAEDTEDFWPGYKINFALQVIIIQNGSIFATTVDSTAPFLIMIGAGYFRALQHRLYRIYDSILDEPTRAADIELVNCSRFHQRILEYCSRIDKITRTLFFVQLLCTGYNTSLIGIKLAGTDPDRYKYIPFGLLNFGQLFICQWAPDHLIDESEAVSTAAYAVSLPWMRSRIGKLLVLIIARAQRPVQMTAAGVVNLSLENFGGMLKGAVSFFTVLRNFNV